MYQVGADKRYVKLGGLYAEPTTLIIEIFPSTKLPPLGFWLHFWRDDGQQGNFRELALEFNTVLTYNGLLRKIERT